MSLDADGGPARDRVTSTLLSSGTAPGRSRVILAPERRDIIRRLLRQDGAVRVSELASALGVSVETVRRDLEALEKAGLAQRTYGGAVSTQPGSPELPFARRQTERLEQKQRIARAALRLIRPGDNVGMDASTTVLQMALAWPEGLQATVLTNSIPTAIELAKRPAVTVVCPGGIVRQAAWSFVGPLAEQTISSYHLDKVFMSCRGVSEERGPTESNELEVQVKRRMAQVAEQLILLADSSKLDTSGFVTIVPASAVHTLITDAEASPASLERFRKLGIQVIVAE